MVLVPHGRRGVGTGLQVVDRVDTIQEKNGIEIVIARETETETEIGDGMTIATDGGTSIVTTTDVIDGTILIASRNEKIGITILIGNMTLTMIGNDGKNGRGREVRTEVIEGVDGLVRRGVGVRGKIDRGRFIYPGIG